MKGRRGNRMDFDCLSTGRQASLYVFILGRVPVVAAAKKDRRFILAGLLGSKKMCVGIALAFLCPCANRIVFGIEYGLDRMRFAGVPFTPASRIDKAAHFCIEENYSGVRPPRPAQVHGLGHIGVGG